MGLRILFVNVTSALRTRLEPTLARQGYDVLWTSRASRDAIEGRFRPDVILTADPSNGPEWATKQPDFKPSAEVYGSAAIPVLVVGAYADDVVHDIHRLFPPPDWLELDGVRVSLRRRVACHPQRQMKLSTLECRLLRFLAERPEHVSEDEVRTKVWGYAPTVRSSAVRNAVYRLRRKVELNPSHPVNLQHAPGRGYRLNLS